MKTLAQLTDIKTIMEFRAKVADAFNTVGHKLGTWKNRKIVFQTYVTKLLVMHYLYGSEAMVAEVICKDYLEAAINLGLEVDISKTHTMMLTETELYFAVILYKYIWQETTGVSCKNESDTVSEVRALVDEYFGIDK